MNNIARHVPAHVQNMPEHGIGRTLTATFFEESKEKHYLCISRFAEFGFCAAHDMFGGAFGYLFQATGQDCLWVEGTISQGASVSGI
jgi:hypothetical protein